MTALGLTWDHPRGRDALREAARRAPEPVVEWAVQPLEGFESAPIAELAAAHDLLVLDHPHVGEAVAEGCLRPLDDLFPAADLARWREGSVGPSMASYVWAGRHWALPLDVATQVVAHRLPAPPGSWDEVEEIAARLPVALSVAGPHALLTLLTMAAGEGVRPRGEDLLPDATALPALARIRRLMERAPAGTDALNPIALLEAMAAGDVALCPAVFGYVTYAGRVAFSDSIRGPGGLGGVLGGTGIGVTARAQPSPDLLAHLAHLMDPGTQAGLLASHGGQPSARAAWTDPGVNARSGGFYAATLATAEAALLRPRFDGYVAFQTAASARIRAGGDEAATLADIRRLWREARTRARGPLEDGEPR